MAATNTSDHTGFLDPIFARYYEESDNTRLTDIDFYREHALAAGGEVLDAGCGSGRVMIPLLQAGVKIEGFDGSPVMLEHLERKLIAKELHARTWLDQLDDFEAESERYALILCTFNTFLHMLDHRSQLRALRNFHRALKPGGKLIMDITNPTNFEVFSRRALGKTFEATLYDAATDSQTTIWRWFERDLITQRGIYHREYQTEGSNGKSDHLTQVEFRWTFPEEMKLLFEMSGFSKWELKGDFKGEEMTENAEMQVWTAWK